MKMEILSCPVKASRESLCVISDASMTMRLSLPVSFLPDHATSTTSSILKDSESMKTAVQDSWEVYDWEKFQVSLVSKQQKKQEVDEWEHEAILELPDDFPRLVVNITRVRRKHFPTAQEDLDVMEDYYRVKTTLHQHFSQLVEVLFEQKLCFHCTYGTSRGMMDGLHAAYPDDVFAMMDYPTEIDDVPLHEYLYTLSVPSKWKSVEYLKSCLRRCSRDIKWKRDVITHLELLAEQEFVQYEEKQRRLSDEIDELTRLRDSFQDKLKKMASQEGKPKGQYLMLRKLEDIENRLMTLLDTFLTEPDLEEEECYSAFGIPSGGVTTSMNVLDMVIAMVFDRLPRDFSQQTTTEEHYQMLFDHHIHILRLWKKDFGYLPLKSRLISPNISGLDAGSIRVPSEDELVADEVSDKEDVIEYVRDSLVNDDTAGDYDEVAYIGVDDDTGRTEDDTDRSCCDKPIDRNIHHDDDSDGYGADFDSDESEEDGKVEDIALAQAQRHQQKHNTCEYRDVPAISARPRRRHRKHTKHIRKLHEVKSEKTESGGERDIVPAFQPFACTAAVSLLRIAKENEMF